MLNQKAIDVLRAKGKGVSTVSVAVSDWNAIVDVLDAFHKHVTESSQASIVFRKMVLEVLDDGTHEARATCRCPACV